VSFNSLVAIILGMVQVVNRLTTILDREQLIKTGKGLAIAEALVLVAKQVSNAKQIEAIVAKQSDIDIADELSEYSYDDKRD